MGTIGFFTGNDPRALEEALGNNEEDLATNREGRLTPKQAGRLVPITLLILAFTVTLFGAASGFIIIDVSLFENPRNTIPGFIVSAIALVFIGLGVFIARLAVPRFIEVVLRRVDSLEGSVRLLCTPKAYTSMHYSGYNYSCLIGNHSFYIPPAAYNQMADGLSYRVYFTRYSRTLVAIEPISLSKKGG